MTGEQITLFEASGDELASLAVRCSTDSVRLASVAATIRERGYTLAALSYERQSRVAAERAEVFETALQFETLAGLA